MRVQLGLFRGDANCRAVHWVACECSTKFDIVEETVETWYDRKCSFLESETQSLPPPPAMDDNGFRLWESHAILAYLAKRDESIYPSDVKQRARVDQMLSFDARTFQPAIAAFVYPTAFERQMASAAAREGLKAPLAQLDAALASPFVAGSFFSIADVAVHCSLSSLELMDDGTNILSEYANVARWYGECKERAHCKTANVFFDEWKGQKQSEAQRLGAAQDDASELWLTIIGFVQGVFHAVDTDGNGVLDKQEIKAATTKVFHAVMQRSGGGEASRLPSAFAIEPAALESVVEDVLATLDGDQNAKVSFDEVKAALSGMGITQEAFAAQMVDFPELKDSMLKVFQEDGIIATIVEGLGL